MNYESISVKLIEKLHNDYLHKMKSYAWTRKYLTSTEAREVIQIFFHKIVTHHDELIFIKDDLDLFSTKPLLEHLLDPMELFLIDWPRMSIKDNDKLIDLIGLRYVFLLSELK